MFWGYQLAVLLEGPSLCRSVCMSGERRAARPGNQVQTQRMQISSWITFLEHKRRLVQVPAAFMHPTPTHPCSAVTLCAYPESQNVKHI